LGKILGVTVSHGLNYIAPECLLAIQALDPRGHQVDWMLLTESPYKGALITAKGFSLPIWMIVMLSKKVGWMEEEMRKMRYAKHRGKSKELRHLDEMEKAIRKSA
jgi:hypothetical protein